MFAISISSDNLCLHKKINKTSMVEPVFVIVVAERWVSFYRIFDRQNVSASELS